MSRLLIGILMALPFLEIAGFVVIGGRIGLGLTLLWLLAVGMLGMALIRHGGLNALTKLQTALNEQREPGHSLIDGAVMVTAGLLLIVPGFVSDFLALILILPVTRNLLLRHAATHFETRIYRSGGAPRGSHTVIEGEFEIIEPEDDLAPDRPTRRLERPDDPL
ncbi:FxsA family protein [Dongia mobilis]|uniref:FxsA family protein n=1 Tax=Dongia sp. TaxID=1977262 RepID=UPI0026F10704